MQSLLFNTYPKRVFARRPQSRPAYTMVMSQAASSIFGSRVSTSGSSYVAPHAGPQGAPHAGGRTFIYTDIRSILMVSLLHSKGPMARGNPSRVSQQCYDTLCGRCANFNRNCWRQHQTSFSGWLELPPRADRQKNGAQ